MIIDTLKSAATYASLHPHFGKAFEHLQSIDLYNLEDGKYDVDGENIRINVSNKNGMTAEESISKFECHDKHIDIQLCISGVEKMGWKSRKDCNDQRGEYNAEKDVVFYNDTPDMYFQLTNNQFVIFYPDDVHAPMIGDGPIKKLVVKIKL